MSLDASLSLSLSHAIAFLTRPLAPHVSALQFKILNTHLSHGLTARFSKSSDIAKAAFASGLRRPGSNSGSRCLTLSPAFLPPPPVLAACIAANIKWSDWAQALGNVEFDLFIDPGKVSVRVGRNPLLVVWSQAPARPVEAPQPKKQSMRDILAQEDDSDIFAMIDYELSHPDDDLLQMPTRSSSPSSTFSCSESDSGDSFSSLDSLSSVVFAKATLVSAPAPRLRPSAPPFNPAFRPTPPVVPTTTVQENRKSMPVPPVAPAPEKKHRRTRSRVYVDKSKTEVTPYDMGRTNVLTGGVMLGARPRNKA